MFQTTNQILYICFYLTPCFFPIPSFFPFFFPLLFPVLSPRFNPYFFSYVFLFSSLDFFLLTAPATFQRIL